MEKEVRMAAPKNLSAGQIINPLRWGQVTSIHPRIVL